MDKKQAYQTISWFYDLYKRDLLELSPSYQRKSVWNQRYKDYYIDTILLNYPCPAIFLYEEIDAEGVAKYYVVDGKQRLTAIFNFLEDKYPVFEDATNQEFRGKFFKDLARDIKIRFYRYNLSVEYLLTNEESIINNIFERINKNIAKLTPQELRHARLDGCFIKAAESLTEWMADELPNLPRINRKSLNQMKDVEYTSLLLLLIDEGVKGYLQEELDEAFTERESSWETEDEVTQKFKDTINKIKLLVNASDGLLQDSRLRNQADLYGIFGAFYLLGAQGINFEHTAVKLNEFLLKVDVEADGGTEDILAYYKTIRSNVNQGTVRQERIDLLKKYFVLV